MKSGELQVSRAEMIDARRELKRARELAGKTPQDFEQIVGSSSNYYDLENCDGDLFNAISLGELSQLCSELGIKPRDLFDRSKDVKDSISRERLLSITKEYLHQNKLSVPEFVDRIGFEIAPTLNDPSRIMDWNVDFLRWLCCELGIDWLSALPIEPGTI